MVDPNTHQAVVDRSREAAEIELDEDGFVDTKGEEKEAESCRRIQRAECRGLLRVYLLEKSSVEAQKCCFPHCFSNVSIAATFAVNLYPKVSTVLLSRKSVPALLVSSSLMSTNPSSV